MAQDEPRNRRSGEQPQREALIEAPLVIAVQAVDDLDPPASGRQWTASQYSDRDAVLAALGVPAFGRQRGRNHQRRERKAG